MFEKPFNFDQLMNLAKHEPDRLDALFKAEIESIINAAPESFQQRLRGLQFEVDCHRKLNKSSYEACKKISEMMLDSVQKLNYALNTPRELRDVEQSAPAKVLAFNTPILA